MARLLALAISLLVLAPAASGSSTAPPSLGALLQRHVPVLVLHPQERIPPVAVDGFLAGAVLQRPTTSGGWRKVAAPLPAGQPTLRLDLRPCRSRKGPAATSCYVSAQETHGTDPVVYGAAFRRKNRIELQYWLFYPWNAYSPTVPPGELWQVHEGDWESVAVVLDLTGKPLQVGLSAHCAGSRRAWAKVRKRGVRPLVYVALGSHANFFDRGLYRLDPRCPGAPFLIEIIRSFGAKPVDRTAAGEVLLPRLVRVTAKKPSWMAFAGAWGEDAFVHLPGNPPLAYANGPRGPAFHEQWRRPVAETLSWPRR